MNGLGGEIRQVLLNKLSSHGGHVGPNLGMVEATIAPALRVRFTNGQDSL